MLNITLSNAHMKDLYEKTINEREMITIEGDYGNAVLMSEFEYRSLLETLQVYLHPDYLKSIIDGINTPVSNCIPVSEVWADV